MYTLCDCKITKLYLTAKIFFIFAKFTLVLKIICFRKTTRKTTVFWRISSIMPNEEVSKNGAGKVTFFGLLMAVFCSSFSNGARKEPKFFFGGTQ